MDLRTIISTDVFPALNAADAAGLDFWTEAQLYEFLDAAVKRLTRLRCLVLHDGTTVTVSAGTTEGNYPSLHIATMYVAAGDLWLEPTNQQEMDAYDNDWRTTKGNALSHWLSYPGLEKLTTYPDLYSGTAVLRLIYQSYFADVSKTANYTVSIPTVIRDWLFLQVIADARDAETEGKAREIASTVRGVADQIGSIIRGYWGQEQEGDSLRAKRGS